MPNTRDRSRRAMARRHTMNAPGARAAGISLLLGLCGCANNAAWVTEPVHPLGPTLRIVNNTSLEYRVTVTPALVVHARPGQTACVRVGNTHEARRIEVFALASARPYYTPVENLMTAPGWILEIGLRPTYDVLSLRPAEPCMR